MTKSDTNAESVAGANARVEELGPGCFAYSADGCSNTGFIVGDRGVLVIDGQGTPELAESALQKIQEITDKPVKLLVLTHFHSDTTMGAEAFEPGEIIASDLTRRMIDTRGKDELRFARARFPALYKNVKAKAKSVTPSMTIASSMSIDLGNCEVRLMHLGRGHTMGDLVVWVPRSGVIFAGDLVQKMAVPYCGDAHLTDWPRALDRILAFRPNALMPGRGKSVIGSIEVTKAVETTRDFVTTLRDSAAACVEENLGLKDTFLAVRDALAPRFGEKADFDTHLQFNVARAYDEALGLDQPQAWSIDRWRDLEDALSNVAPAQGNTPTDEAVAPAEPLAESRTEDAPEASLDAGAVPEDDKVDEAAAMSEPGNDLVSDSDFAASLLGTPDDLETADADVLDLPEDTIVSSDEKKVLEPAGA